MFKTEGIKKKKSGVKCPTATLFTLGSLSHTDVTIFPPTLSTQALATAVFTCPTKCGELGEDPWGFHRPLLTQLEHGYTMVVLSFTRLDVPP